MELLSHACSFQGCLSPYDSPSCAQHENPAASEALGLDVGTAVLITACPGMSLAEKQASGSWAHPSPSLPLLCGLTAPCLSLGLHPTPWTMTGNEMFSENSSSLRSIVSSQHYVVRILRSNSVPGGGEADGSSGSWIPC